MASLAPVLSIQLFLAVDEGMDWREVKTLDRLKAMAVEEPTLQEGLSQLVNHELFYQRGWIPRAKYIFQPALIRDAAYQSLMRRTRQKVHAQITQLLEARFADIIEMQPEWVAYHASRGEAWDKARTFYRQAAAKGPHSRRTGSQGII